MDDLSYLSIQTLADSLHPQSLVSLHDLIDAYATFVNRVRPHAQLLCDTFPAIAFLKVHKDSFVRVLRRDVHLAHVDPLSSRSPHVSSLHEISHPDVKQYARDTSSLCHHALCTLTTIFRFPALFSVFSERDLSTLYGDVLDIALAEHLPVLNQSKTYFLSLWALSCHRLPEAVLSYRRDDLCSALQQSLDTRRPVNITLNGIKSISHALEYHSSGFLLPLFPLLPRLMSTLRSRSSELRLQVSIALGKFAIALISLPDLSLTQWHSLSNHFISFLDSYCDESQLAPDDTHFSRIVRTTFSTESPTHSRDTPTWLLAILASLIVICGPTLFRKPIVLRFILHSLAIALTHKRSVVRALHPHVWRCLVWTFSQMLRSPENVDPAIISTAFSVVKQEVSGGIGTALVNILLSDQVSAMRPDQRGDRVSQALSVIKAMVQADCKHTRREAFMFLQAFTNNAQVRHQITQTMYEIPASFLLNGAIIGVEWDSLPSTIHCITKMSVTMHWLEEAEIAQHYDTLLVIWKHFATKVDLDSCLIDVWLSILLACSRQLECPQQVSVTKDILKSFAVTIVEILPPVPLGCQPDWGSWSTSDQLCRLGFIDQLWSAMQKAFVAISLTEAAELILASILKYAFHVLDLDVRASWGRLCANLLTAASPSFLRDTHDRVTSQLVIQNRRELWDVVATSLSSANLETNRKVLVKFLAIPICDWVLSKSELEVWQGLVRNVVAASKDATAVNEILQYFEGKEAENWESIIPVLSFLLTCTRENDKSPTEELLSMLDASLIVSYSRAHQSAIALTHSLELLNIVRSVVVSTPEKVVHILQTLCSSLCLWIEDRAEVMSDDQFNSAAVSLYCETLKALEVLPLSIQSLQEMETFLASAFSRIPMPAIAPFAFEKFWRATYHGHRQICNNLPPKIKSCLVSFVAAYGGDLADGLSLTTESQSQSISDSSKARFPAEHRDPILTHAEACLEEFRTRDASQEYEQTFTGQEHTFLMSSPDDDALQPTALRRLQEYSSRMDASSLDGLDHSTNSHQMRFLASNNVIPRANQKRKLVDGGRFIELFLDENENDQFPPDDAPRKRSRTSRCTLRAVRKLESEPATRDVTPIDVPRMNSVPLQKRAVFDGVQVPTLRAVMQNEKRTQLGKGKALLSALPSPVGCDEDTFDWEDSRVDVTPSEVDVDLFLVDVLPCSPLPTQASISPVSTLWIWSAKGNVGERDDSIRLPSPETTWARIDALRDIYSAVANGASQIPMSELLQATQLVHQIGAALTEQMGKKMGDNK